MTGKRDRRGKRTLTAAEKELWRAAVGDIERLDETAREAASETAKTPVEPDRPGGPARARGSGRAVARAGGEAAPAGASETPPPARGAVPGLDRRSAERLRRGRLPIDARLDLHGMTQARAHAALGRFLARAQADGARCVLVITGKGSRRLERDEGFMPDRSLGVLREMVPRWLSEPGNRARVVAVQPARPQHGGAGALYVLLRRTRKKGV